MPTPEAFYACSESEGDPVEEYGNFFLEVNSSTELGLNVARMLGRTADRKEYSRVDCKLSQRKTAGSDSGESVHPGVGNTSADGCVDNSAGEKSPCVMETEKSGEKSPVKIFTKRKVGKCFLSKLVDSLDCLQSSSPESDSVKLEPPENDDPHSEYPCTTLAQPVTSKHVAEVPHSTTDVTTTTDGSVFYIDRFAESVYDHHGVQSEFVLEDDERALEEMENLIKREETNFWAQDSLDIGDASGDVLVAL